MRPQELKAAGNPRRLTAERRLQSVGALGGGQASHCPASMVICFTSWLWHGRPRRGFSTGRVEDTEATQDQVSVW